MYAKILLYYTGSSKGPRSDKSIVLFSASGKIRAAIGKAQLLITKKFKQFEKLCNENIVSFTTTVYS